jgi:hypothetical protein
MSIEELRRLKLRAEYGVPTRMGEEEAREAILRLIEELRLLKCPARTL